MNLKFEGCLNELSCQRTTYEEEKDGVLERYEGQATPNAATWHPVA